MWTAPVVAAVAWPRRAARSARAACCGRFRSSCCGRSRPFSRTRPACRARIRARDLEPRDRREFRRTARLTWRFFEEIVSPGDNWLVPDNYQENRPDPIAHRTSPTNIGLQMMATVSAWDLGYHLHDAVPDAARSHDRHAAETSAISRALLQLVRHAVARAARAPVCVDGRQRQPAGLSHDAQR